MREGNSRCQEAADRRSGINGVTTPLVASVFRAFLDLLSTFLYGISQDTHLSHQNQTVPIQSTLPSGARAQKLSSHNHDLLALHL
jgi:hypothetical protein